MKTEGGEFTPIELLIIVPIITILAAIAIPIFLEAQLRDKVTQALTEMRTNWPSNKYLQPKP